MENKAKLMEYISSNSPVNPNVASGLVDDLSLSSVSWNDLADKPFGEIVSENEKLLINTYTTVNNQGRLTVVGLSDINIPSLPNGQKVFFSANGITIETTYSYSSGYFTIPIFPAFGDYAVLTGMMSTGNTVNINNSSIKDGDLVKMWIVETESEIKYLDDKFIPDTIARIENVSSQNKAPKAFVTLTPGEHLTDTDGNTYATILDVQAAIYNGINTFITYDSNGNPKEYYQIVGAISLGAGDYAGGFAVNVLGATNTEVLIQSKIFDANGLFVKNLTHFLFIDETI